MIYYSEQLFSNYLQAYAWFSVAAENGQADDRSFAAAHLSTDQLAQAKKLATLYLEQYKSHGNAAN
ncbi:hypothetical protein [Aeromonas veronii]|uniref:hypothetical protein n=1 Tax=Aeromonas veronii TaxID=654 RepID=UPI0015FF7145|nr:hypothetical protein [Aeromonas veronii]